MSRQKGLSFVREVKAILQSLGHETEGPAYLIMQVPKKIPLGPNIVKEMVLPVQTHKDFFGVFDLISWHPEHGFAFHQVSIDEEKSRKIKKITEKGMAGNIWGRCKQGRSVAYRTYFVTKTGEVTEGEIYYLNEIKKVRTGETRNA